ncbi:C-X-C motif chemokine 17 isoform X1 [Rattus norvegicus]|uniref:C-X-C motif chemokine 17 isoform X1 n=1 Tax=Rattus norvegicus TaxID=10116 RepID=UPI0019172C76|nr:C-X-C motif chemokine 17 isoform X1 [Rattus norvegicus]
MKLLASPFLLLLTGMFTATVSSSPNQDWSLRVSKRKTTAVLEPPRKQCPCDHVKGSEKKNRRQKHHRKSQRPSRTCQQFLKRCQLASFTLPL